MQSIEINQKAPELSLLDHNRKRHCLSDYQGKWLILFFYPKDNTPGCTVEACHFRDNYSNILEKNAQLLGINTDDEENHIHFIEKQQLPFPLLIDKHGEVSKRYGSLFKLGPIKFCKRHSFIINPKGNITKIYRKVISAEHSTQVLNDLMELQEKYIT